jgi:hypothetical protein
MARSYSEAFLRELAKADASHLGIKLARLCVEGRLPVAYVAKALQVSRMSLHSWFRGKAIAPNFYPRLEALIRDMEYDIRRGNLPVPDKPSSKKYLKSITGVEV